MNKRRFKMKNLKGIYNYLSDKKTIDKYIVFIKTGNCEKQFSEFFNKIKTELEFDNSYSEIE
jgi:hypothetical protein